MGTKVAIQGIAGSFHHQVALDYFGSDIHTVDCLSFEAVAKSLVDGTSDSAVMAIENSIAGAILPNYALIDRHKLVITGECYLNIRQHLMALPGQSVEKIAEVHSHPMALLQCMDFLNAQQHLKLVEDKDTAETARRISTQQLYGIAAIGSVAAAERYGLEILAAEIQTVQNNMTRFVVLERQALANESANKASLKFDLPHEPGSLAFLLNAMRDGGLNLTMIQSLPKIETPWQYSFFADVTFDNAATFNQSLPELKGASDHFKILGLYQNQQP